MGECQRQTREIESDLGPPGPLRIPEARTQGANRGENLGPPEWR